MSGDGLRALGGFGVGARVAGYLLEEQIGQGGMAVVFRALDERLGRRVALKILAPALAADEGFRQRFIRESRAAAAVDNPHIIPVFEAGEAGGVLYIAMRYVRGGDVGSLVSRLGPLPPRRVAEIISQVASALDAAHGSGLVHRDVKPANMLLDASGVGERPDHVYLSDFGLSKASLSVSGLTGSGQFLGTLDYISPEQIEGRPVDGRADEYSLACAAFELLSGVPPFRRPEALTVMYAQLHEPPPRLTDWRPGLPPAVDQVFARALAKAPGDRYASCREFAGAMRRSLDLAAQDLMSRGLLQPQAGHPRTEIAGSAPGRAADGAIRDGAAGRAGHSMARGTVTSTGPAPAWPASGSGMPGEPASYRDVAQPADHGQRRRLVPVMVAGACILAAAGAGLIVANVLSSRYETSGSPVASHRSSQRASNNPASSASHSGTKPASTQVTVYEPWAPQGLAQGIRPASTVRGYCWESSLGSIRSDAFRCMTGNDIYDPCFASPYAPGQVACGYPSLTSVTIIKLTRALPQAGTVPSGKQPNPWLVVLQNGQRCWVNTGAGIEVGGMTQTFACRNGASLFGSLQRNERIWTIFYQAKSGSSLTPAPIAKAYE